jgi:hypothetical protein
LSIKTFTYLLAALLVFFELAPAAEVTGEWVARKMSDRNTGNDSMVEMKMELIDTKGRTTERKLFMISKDYEGEGKMLLRFTEPEDIRGTSFLVWEQKSKDDERFLYLPALGRTRRITSAEKTDSFAGSDFSYEDISGREFEDFTYRLLQDTTRSYCPGCYLLESVPKNKDTEYAKTVALVDTTSFLPIRVEYFDSRDRLFKRFTLLEKEKISGIWTMMEMEMEDLKGDHMTRISVLETQYNKGVEDRKFTRRELERGAD